MVAEWAQTALDLERVGIEQLDAAAVGLAIVSVVDRAGPSVGSGRLHAENSHTHHGAIAPGRVGIHLVGLRLAGFLVDRLRQPHDRAAQ